MERLSEILIGQQMSTAQRRDLISYLRYLYAVVVAAVVAAGVAIVASAVVAVMAASQLNSVQLSA